MIKHMVVFRFKDDIPEREREKLLEEQMDFPNRFPKMRNWSMGRNISKRDDTFTYGFVVEFESEKDLLEYLNSEAHESFVKNRFRPCVEKRAIVSYEWPAPL